MFGLGADQERALASAHGFDKHERHIHLSVFRVSSCDWFCEHREFVRQLSAIPQQRSCYTSPSSLILVVLQSSPTCFCAKWRGQWQGRTHPARCVISVVRVIPQLITSHRLDILNAATRSLIVQGRSYGPLPTTAKYFVQTFATSSMVIVVYSECLTIPVSPRSSWQAQRKCSSHASPHVEARRFASELECELEYTLDRRVGL